MKALAVAASLLLWPTVAQEPWVTLSRAYGRPPNIEWRLVYRVPQSQLWMGIMLRDSVTQQITGALKVEWPACVSGQRAE